MKNLVSVGGPLSSSEVALRVVGPDLNPEEITRLLNCAPSYSHRNGDIQIGKHTGTKVVKKSGLWRVNFEKKMPAELDTKIQYLLGSVTDDILVWNNLAGRFSIDMFCGLFLNRTNEGCNISPKTLLELGKRGIELSLDIYAPDFDQDLDERMNVARQAKNKPTH